MKPVAFSHTLPGSVAEAIRLASSGADVKIIGGGQSLGPMLNLRLARPEVLIDVAALDHLRRIEDTGRHVEIGSAIRHAEIEDSAIPDPITGMLPHVAGGIAYRAVRNRGTIGGSLCHADPAADWISAMTVLDATLVIAGTDGTTREVPMTDFMEGAYRTVLAPGEVLCTIRIPKCGEDARWGYYKICRKVGEFADAIATVVIDPKRRYCRVVFGAVSGAPLVARDLAQSVAETGRAAPHHEVEAALLAFDPTLDHIKRHQLAIAYARCMAEAMPHD